MKPSFSLPGLVKLTRMDSSEGWTYVTSRWYPLQACVKIKRYSLKIAGKSEDETSFVLVACHCWTWHSSSLISGLGYPCSITCPFVFGWSILPLIWLFHLIIMTLGPMLSLMLPHSGVVSRICSRNVQSIVLSLYNIWVIVKVLKIIPLYSLFRVDDEGIIMTLLRWVTSYRLQLIIQGDNLETPFSTLELACLNCKFFASDNKFSSLAFDQLISWVFDFIFVITFMDCIVVPWEPLSLWVIPLMPVNDLHQCR